MRLADLVAAAQTCVTQSVAQGRPYPQQLYLGEFGFRQHDNVTLNFVRDLLRLTTRITQQKRMRPTSTSTTISPAEALDILPASAVTPTTIDSGQSLSTPTTLVKEAPPPLATIWVWEFEPQQDTLSLEAGRDDWLIDELAVANRATQMLGRAKD
jgi:hypothetical protein